jgi:M6 family metalloprotease-like protein
MLTTTTVATGLAGCIGSAFSQARDAAFFVEWSGRLSAFEAGGGGVGLIGSGWLQPEGVAVTADGTTAYVTESGGDLRSIDLGAGDRASSQLLVGGLDLPHQVVLSADEGSLFTVEFGPAGRLLRWDLANATLDTVATGLEGAVGLAISEDATTAYVSEQAPGGGRLRRFDLAGGGVTTLLTGLIAPFFLQWADGLADGFGRALDPGAVLLLVERDPANRLSAVDLRGAASTRVDLATVAHRPSSVCTLADRVLVFCDAEVVSADASTGILPGVRLHLPAAELFVGGWARVAVDCSGVGFDDLDFEVTGGPLAGGVSYSRDATFDPAKPTIMLLAGSQPGKWTLRAVDRATATVLAEEPFTVTTQWPDEALGPAVQFVGESQAFVFGSAWGGGPTGPQNVDVFPASGTRRVAVLLVDTTSARYPTAAATLTPIRAEWQSELLGVTDPDGVLRGVRQYFQETSFGRYDISLVGNQVWGPFNLPGAFTDYYTWNTTRSVWWANGNLFQACITAAQAQVDFDQVDTLVCVMRTVPATATAAARFAWPVAGGGTFTYQRPGATSNSSRAFPCLTMPDDWEARDSSGRRTHETLAHEVGHNLGLGDLYMNLPGFDAAIQARDISGWDLMSNEDPLPHLSLAHRLMLGWVRPQWVRSFDFTGGGGVDQTLTLHAAELTGLNGPPAGRFAGIEVRRADGWNYYFEYRAGQVAQIADRALPTDRRVLGTDVVSPTFTVPQSRRGIILLPNDPDGDGPVLGSGGDYDETDPSGPAQFQFNVVSTSADSAVVRVRYGAGGRPDPSIRPWPGGTDWQSPDIEVSNARSATRPEWNNTPWAGQSNTVTARVTNRGDFVATNVAVDFWVKDFTVGNAPETWIGRDTQTIPVGATVPFTTTWTPPANTPENDAHYCLVVRIPLYQDPGNPAIVELTELNNVAQSNYTRFISATASPASRRTTSLTVSNPYSERTRVFVVPQQSTSWYRTYLERSWLWLDPGESRSVAVMVESLWGDPARPGLKQQRGAIFERPHELSLLGLIENPLDPQLHTAEIMGGANARVMTGRATRIRLRRLDEKVALGLVETVDDGRPVGYGNVLVSLKPRGEADRAVYRGRQLSQDGTFAIELGAFELLLEGEVVAQAHFLGAFALADCDSRVIRLRR